MGEEQYCMQQALGSELGLGSPWLAFCCFLARVLLALRSTVAWWTDVLQLKSRHTWCSASNSLRLHVSMKRFLLPGTRPCTAVSFPRQGTMRHGGWSLFVVLRMQTAFCSG